MAEMIANNHGIVKAMKVEGISQNMKGEKNGIYNFIWTIPTTPHGESEFYRMQRDNGQNVFRSGKLYCEEGPLQGPGEHFELFFFLRGEIAEIFVKMCFESSEAEPFVHTQVYAVEFTTDVPTTVDARFQISDKPTFPPEFLEREGKTRILWIKNANKLYLPTEIRRINVRIKMKKTWQLDSLDEVAELYDSPDFVQHSSQCASANESVVLKKMNLLFSPFCSDIKIICGHREYFAHKLILSSKSTVFLAMFCQPTMIENESGKVVIEDFEPEIVEEFLRFVYTGAIKCLCKNVADICLIAEKYDIQPLKTLCENYLLTTISHENVHERLGLGKIINSDKLIRKCNKILQN